MLNITIHNIIHSAVHSPGWSRIFPPKQPGAPPASAALRNRSSLVPCSSSWMTPGVRWCLATHWVLLPRKDTAAAFSLLPLEMSYHWPDLEILGQLRAIIKNRNQQLQIPVTEGLLVSIRQAVAGWNDDSSQGLRQRYPNVNK